MKTTLNSTIVLISIFLVSCGSGGSDNRPSGTFNFQFSDSDSTVGCSEEFLAFISSSSSGGGITEFQFDLAKTGSSSLNLDYQGAELSLSSSSDPDAWSGTVSGTITLQGCQLFEQLTVELSLSDEGNLDLELIDAWSNVPLNASCPFGNDDCTNVLVGTATKL